MTTTALTTELEAVNLMLSQIDEAPVNSLSTSSADVALAKQILDETVRNVLGEGWRFNTSYQFKLVPDIDGKITVNGVLDIEFCQRSNSIPALRGTKLFDAYTNSDVFTDAVTAERIVWLLTWNDLPQPARQYIAIVAARVFQRRLQTSVTVDKLTATDEAKARIALERHNDAILRFNSLRNWRAYKTLRRYPQS